jgi:hypothetical protein
VHQYKVGALFERIVIDVAGPFLQSDQGNPYLLIAMYYFTKWPEAYSVPTRRRQRWQKPRLLTSAV